MSKFGAKQCRLRRIYAPRIVQKHQTQVRQSGAVVVKPLTSHHSLNGCSLGGFGLAAPPREILMEIEITELETVFSLLQLCLKYSVIPLLHQRRQNLEELKFQVIHLPDWQFPTWILGGSCSGIRGGGNWTGEGGYETL